MRIVIVEDEIKIREGMGKMIESQTGHMIVGEAADGEEGLQMVLRLKPDLVITDIRMPRMDGLEMLKELMERKVKIHSVILSGYSEFEYARRAMRYGADAYLLKPLAVDDVRDMLQEIEKKILEEKSLTYGHPESWLRDILFGNIEDSVEHTKELCKVCGFEENMKYELAAGYIGTAQSAYSDMAKKEISRLRELFSEFKIYLLYQENRQILFCLTAGSDLKEEQKERYNQCFYNELIRKYHKNGEYPVWVKVDCSVENLRSAREQLEKHLSYALVMEECECITNKMITSYQAETYEHPLEIANRLKNAICKGKSEEIIHAGNDFIAYMRDHDFAPTDVRYGFVKFYYLVEDTLQDIDWTLREHLKNSGILRRMEHVLTFKELQETWEDIVKILTGTRVRREDISNYIIKKALNYIREHYNEGITQEEVSRKLEITPEYLSALFNREMGISFSLFLNQFRISHAKRLLKGTDMKIYEIAEAVGYNDAKYFTRVFKEEQGVTPGEYRQMT